MDIPVEKLGQFGLSIKVNRKERLRKTSSARWTQRGFCEGICSQVSLVNQEKGCAGRFMDNYEKMAERLGLKVGYDAKADKVMERYIKHLYKAVEFYDLAMIEKYTGKSLTLLEPYKDCLWYADLYRVVNALKNHYLHEIYLTKIERDTFTEMLGEFTELWDRLIKSIIFCAAYDDVETNEYIERYSTLDIENTKGAINMVNSMMYHLAVNNISEFRKVFTKAKSKWRSTKNYIRLIDAYNIACIYGSLFEVKEIDETEKEIEELMSLTKIPNSKVAEVYFCLSTVYYELKQYEKALKMATMSAEYDINKVRCNFLIIGSAQHCLDLKAMIPYYNDEEFSKLSEDNRLLYKYFTMEDEIPALIKQDFLVKDILPRLETGDELSLKILKKELELLIKETRRYKDLTILEEKTKELLEFRD